MMMNESKPGAGGQYPDNVKPRDAVAAAEQLIQPAGQSEEVVDEEEDQRLIEESKRLRAQLEAQRIVRGSQADGRQPYNDLEEGADEGTLEPREMPVTEGKLADRLTERPVEQPEAERSAILFDRMQRQIQLLQEQLDATKRMWAIATSGSDRPQLDIADAMEKTLKTMDDARLRASTALGDVQIAINQQAVAQGFEIYSRTGQLYRRTERRKDVSTP